MAVSRSFICCLLYWTAINGLGQCGKIAIPDSSIAIPDSSIAIPDSSITIPDSSIAIPDSSIPKDSEDEGKSGEFATQQLGGYVTALRYEGRSPVYKYLKPTTGKPAQDFVTYGSTMVISSPKIATDSRDQHTFDDLQVSSKGSTYMKTDRETKSAAGDERQPLITNGSTKSSKKNTTRKKRVIDSPRMFRYRKQFPPLPHQETPNLSENPPAYADEETRGNRNKKNKHGRGNRNRKQGGRKKTNITESGQTLEEELIMVGSNRGGRVKGKSRKLKTAVSRDGQSNRRLRQHMQHKKKVKQFLQKRIQEQIAQRRHRRGIPA